PGGLPASALTGRRRRGSGIPGGVGPDGAVLPLPVAAQGWWVPGLIAAAAVIALISLSTGQTPGWQITAVLVLMSRAGRLVTAWPLLPTGHRVHSGAAGTGAVIPAPADPADAGPAAPRAQAGGAPGSAAGLAGGRAARRAGKPAWHRRAWVRRSLLG